MRKYCDNFKVCQNYSDSLKKIKIEPKVYLYLCCCCEDEFKLGNYCYYCYTIFIGDISDNKVWIGC